MSSSPPRRRPSPQSNSQPEDGGQLRRGPLRVARLPGLVAGNVLDLGRAAASRRRPEEAERRAHRDTKLMISVELAAAFPNQRQANPYERPDLAAYWMEHEDQLDRAAAASAVAAAAAASAAECLRNNWEPAVAAAHAEQAITTATAAAERSAKARIESRDSRMLYFQQVTLPRMIERGQKRL